VAVLAKLPSEEQLLNQQHELIKKITTDSLGTYQDMHQRLAKGGPNAQFLELAPVVQYLIRKLNSDRTAIELALEHSYLAEFREIVLTQLTSLALTKNKTAYPYLDTVEAIQRAMEFFDIAQRAYDPKRNPKLYHSDRYEYYGHFLKGTLPDHIIIPTAVS
jgi:hypothetical protein